MYLGKVIGTVVSTSKTKDLEGYKFLIVKKLDEDMKSSGEIEVAIDGVGAGVGETVLVTNGSTAKYALNKKETIPADSVIVGIVDTVTVE